MIDPLIQHILAISLSLLFFVAARHKMADRRRFQAQLEAYRLLPVSLLSRFSQVLPVMELLVSLVLLIPLTRAAGAVMAALLLLVYATSMAINLMRGRHDIDCGCGGKPQPLSWWLVARNVLLTLMAAALVLPVSQRAFVWSDLPFFILLTLLLAMVYVAVGQLVSNQSAISYRSRHHG